jgi:hypothetical protein
MPNSIHFICEHEGIGLKGLEATDRATKLWRSYCWDITSTDAETLIGGWIYLHPTKNQPSAFGGRILRFERIWDEGGAKRQDRVWFEFEARQEGRGHKWRGQDHGMAYTSRPVPANLPHEEG